jgi:hypothetical protein
MNVERIVQNIKTLHSALTGKSDNEVQIFYRGTGAGITKPWQARIDAREAVEASQDAAVSNLYLQLIEELRRKIANTQRETVSLQSTLESVLS